MIRPLVTLAILILLALAAVAAVGVVGKAMLLLSLGVLGLLAQRGSLAMASVNDEAEQFDLFWRQFMSSTALTTVIFGRVGWLHLNPLVIGALLIANAALAVSLAIEVAKIHPAMSYQVMVSGWTLIGIGLAVLYAVLTVPASIQKLEGDIGGRWFPWLMVGFVAALGIVAHAFKQASQEMYGITEIIFGLATIYKVALKWSESGTQVIEWVAVIGSIYIVARGLNNFYEAKWAEGQG